MNFRTSLVFLVLICSWSLAAASTDKRNEKHRGSKAERTIAADARITVSACSVSGGITVHGWDRNEVRARSSEAAEIKFQRKDEGAVSSPAKKIELLVLDKEQGPTQPGFCESSSEIELDVPRGATVQLRTRDSDISVFEVATVYVNTQSGEVSVEGATRTVEAGSIGGDVYVKDSSGRINLHTGGGSIEANDVRPAETGDTFEAHTLSGEITLDNVTHAQLNAHTVSGSLCMTGPLARSGRYNLRTMSGDLTLTMPEDSSFQLSARFSPRAEIITDFPLTLITSSSAHPSPAPKPGPVPSADPPGSTAPVSPAPKPGPVPSADPPGSTAPVSPAPMSESPEVVATVKVKNRTVIVDVSSLTSRRIDGVHGTGDAKLELASFSGTIHLQKQ